MRKYIIILLLFAGFNANSQIKLNIFPSNGSCKDDCQITVALWNTSNDYYIIPIDTSAVKAYDNDIFWLDFEQSPNIEKSLGTEFLLKNSKNNVLMEAHTQKPHINFDLIDSLLANTNTQKQIFEKRIENWKLKFNIKNNEIAKKNMYIIENLIFLEPGQKFLYNVKVNNFFPFENNALSPYSYYSIVPEEKYYVTLKLNIPKKIKYYFTNKQKAEYKKYKFFFGQKVSNHLILVFRNGEYILSDPFSENL